MTDSQVQSILNLTAMVPADEVSLRADLACAVKALASGHATMRTVRFDGGLTTDSLIRQLERVAKDCDSSLHEAAALRLRTLIAGPARTAKEWADRVQHNGYAWDKEAFLRHNGWRDDPYGQHMWDSFRELCKLLGLFDKTIEVLAK